MKDKSLLMVKGVSLLVIVSVREENGSVVWQLQLYLLIKVDSDLPNSWIARPKKFVELKPMSGLFPTPKPDY